MVASGLVCMRAVVHLGTMWFLTAFVHRLLHSVPLFYLVLLWPGREAFRGLWREDGYYPALMYDSGVWSVYLLIASLAVTPLLRVHNLGRWVLRRRRHIGVASALFAGVHVWYYVLYEGSLAAILFDFWQLEYFVGWVSFAVFLALAVTSNDWSVRRLGRGWKRLHLAVYAGGLCAMWHWYLLDWYVARSLFWCAVFATPLLIRVPLRHLIRWRRSRIV